MRRTLLALLALAACASTASYSRTPVPCQGQAVELVWRGCYGRTDQPPDIWWVPAAAQNCTGHGGRRGFKVGASCAAGSTVGDSVSLVDYREGWQGTALAHESMHVAQARDGQPPDYRHTSAAFQAGGAVEQCNARLRAAKLCGP